jgi:signal peptidase I
MSSGKKYFKPVRDMGISLLEKGTTIRIKAHGYSMYPRIKPGSLIIIEPIQVKGPPAAGEIVAVKRENGMVVHRITRIVIKDGRRYYIARGDSNAYADAPVGLEMIAGRVVKSEPTGENPVPADIRINRKPGYFINRLRVIMIMLRKKIKS